jgi:hypothetical protein
MRGWYGCWIDEAHPKLLRGGMVLFGDRFVIYTAQIWRVVDFLQFVLNCFGGGVLSCSTGTLYCFWYFNNCVEIMWVGCLLILKCN